MSYRCSWATGSAFRPRPSTGLTSNHSATPSRAPSPCSASACLAPTACSNLGRPETSVIVEAYRSLVDGVEGMRPELVGPRRFFTVDVDVTNLFDLRVSEHRDAVALDLDALRGPWEPCPARRPRRPPTRSARDHRARPL